MRIPHKGKLIACCAIAVSTILILSSPLAGVASDTYPLQGWQASTPKEQGMHAYVLADMMEQGPIGCTKIAKPSNPQHLHMIFDCHEVSRHL